MSDNIIELHPKSPDAFQKEAAAVTENDVAILVVKNAEGVYKLALKGEWSAEAYAYISVQIGRLVP